MKNLVISSIFNKCPISAILTFRNNQATEANIEHQLNLKQQPAPHTTIY